MNWARSLVFAFSLCGAMAAGASEYQDAWGPPVGAKMPPLSALDQHGERRDLASLSGERGLLLFAVRSADW